MCINRNGGTTKGLVKLPRKNKKKNKFPFSYKTHCNFKGRDEYWFVHISQWRGYDGIHLLFRGDSDAKILYNGCLYKYYDIECELQAFYDSWKEEADEEELESIQNIDDYIDMCPYVIECVLDEIYREYGHQPITNKGNHMKKNLKPFGRTKEEKEVLRLSKKLKDVSCYPEIYKEFMRDVEWDTHHCRQFTVSESVGDYQVLRIFDVEIQPCDPIEQATEEEKKEYERQIYENGYYDEIWEIITERIYADGGDPYATYDIAEVAQSWINCKTGNVIRLGKVYDENPSWCDFDGEFEVINNDSIQPMEHEDNTRSERFCKTFFENSSEYHIDISVNDILKSHGYKEIDCTDYRYNDYEYNFCTFDDDILIYRNIITETTWEEIIRNYAIGGEWEKKIKLYGTKMLVLRGMLEEKYHPYLDIAAKIVKRTNYDIEDISLYKDMFEAMVELGKDLHNRFYSCPVDLKDMHDKMTKMYANKVKRERERAEQELTMKKLQEAMEQSEYYNSLVETYGDIVIKDDKYQIFLCPSINDMYAEGKAMRHCVFHMGYYKENRKCLILFCRDINDINKRVSTIEIGLEKFELRQNRGLCNAKPDDVETINQLINNNIHLFKKAKMKVLESQQAAEVTMPLAA